MSTSTFPRPRSSWWSEPCRWAGAATAAPARALVRARVDRAAMVLCMVRTRRPWPARSTPRRTLINSLCKRLARDRAAHAARAPAAGAQLGAGDPDHVDAGVLQPGVCLVVPLVGDGHPRRQRQGVVAVVPLLALGGDRVEAGVDLVQGVDAHRLGRGHQER